jgi:hypothetical protein
MVLFYFLFYALLHTPLLAINIVGDCSLKGVAFLAVYKKRMSPELRGGVSVCLHESLDQLFKLGPGVGVSA